MTVRIELFYTPHCPYCPSAKRVLGEVASQFGVEVEVEEVNAQMERERAKSYGIKAVPTIVVNGQFKFVGVPKREALLQAIKGQSPIAP